MKAVNPYLNFNGNTEEAFTFYRSVFGGEFLGVVRYKDSGTDRGIPENELNKIAHIALPIGPGNLLMGTDVLESQGMHLVVGNNSYIFIEAESEEEAERLFSALSDGGEIEMPLQKTPWAERYGSCTDRFGVQWMVDYTGNVQYGEGAQG